MITRNVVLVIFVFVFLFGNILLGNELSGVPFEKSSEKNIAGYAKLKYIKIDFKKIDLGQFAEHIRSKSIYDPQLWDTDINLVQVRNALLDISFFLYNKRSQFRSDCSQLKRDFLQVDDLQRMNKQETQLSFTRKRKKLCQEFILLQNFFETAIDRNCPRNNPFFKNDGWVIDPMEECRAKGMVGSVRHIQLFTAKDRNELPDNLKPELEKYEKSFREAEEKHYRWELEMTEYDLQKILIEERERFLKEFHANFIELYFLEPRADGELLELFSKSKYPETEKVKILMELKIPYKNFRYWESQNRKFRTVAQFVSFDKSTSKVTLEKPNGKKTVARLHKLRYEDIKYVREQTTPQPTTTVQPKP
jgi:hypothetical protein